MAVGTSRHRSPALAGILLVGGAWLLSGSFSAFLGAAPAARSRVAMHGFKEDFEAWRASLTPEEQRLTLKQAQNEFTKKFRNSDEFKADLPDEKVQSLAKVMKKFFENEVEDYKKELDNRYVDYTAVRRKLKLDNFDWRLKNTIIEINRHADRRYYWAAALERNATEHGEKWPATSPYSQRVLVPNSNEDQHNALLGFVESCKKALEDPELPPSERPHYEYWVKNGIPPIGEDLRIDMVRTIRLQDEWIKEQMEKDIAENGKGNETYALQAQAEAIWLHNYAVEKYLEANKEVEDLVKTQVDWYRSEKPNPGTKADIMKELWAELRKEKKELAPLPEDLLALLAKEPANDPDTYRHPWAIRDKLWKSEAIDPWGTKWLVGIFETVQEAKEAFAQWNTEYEQAKVNLQESAKEYVRQQQAKLDADTEGSERIRREVELAKAARR